VFVSTYAYAGFAEVGTLRVVVASLKLFRTSGAVASISRAVTVICVSSMRLNRALPIVLSSIGAA
jgi:hypothetical protein